MKASLTAFAAIAFVGFCCLIVGCGEDELTAPTTNDVPILAPENITVSQNAYGEILISWDANSQSILRGYNVYRMDVAEPAIEKLTPTPVSENHFIDGTAIWEREYEYRVTSVSTGGDESVFVGIVIQVQTPEHGGKLRPQR